jgi:hypothetical protein
MLSVSERFFWWGTGVLKGRSGTVHHHKTNSTEWKEKGINERHFRKRKPESRKSGLLAFRLT